MRRSLTLLSFVAALFSALAVQNSAGEVGNSDGSSWPPAFCRSYDCPRFTLLNKTSKYEIRRYHPSQWVTTNYTSRSQILATSVMFRRLFKYIDGGNSQGLKIDMTVPVITIMPVNTHLNFWDQQTFEMAFYLSVSNPPAPTDSTVNLVQYPESTLYAKSFPGYYYAGFQYKSKIRELKRDIGDDTLYKNHFWLIMGYQSPWERRNRHNEVCLEKV